MSRFARLEAELAAKGAADPAALAAHIGMRKYGRAGFMALAEAGRAKKKAEHATKSAMRSRHLAYELRSRLEPAPAELEDRATAHTVQSINAHPVDTERLRLYWTKNPEGLAKWVHSPHPWQALHDHLAKYIHNPGELDRTTSAWHFDVFHQHTGSDLYRVEHGGKPRGHRIGPG